MSDDPTHTPSGSPRPSMDAPRSAPPPPPPPPPAYPGYYGPPAKESKRGGIITRILGGLLVSLLLISLVANVYLGLAVAALTGGPTEKLVQKGDDDRRVVILPIQGGIDAEMASFVHEALRALEDEPPAALVIRVDSGGGDVTASDQIWHDIDAFKKKHQIPVVASFGGIAASGGYYVAAGADQIYIEQTGKTGSIGVIAMVPTVEGLLQKVGVKVHVIVADGSPDKAVANSVFEHWEPGDANEQVFKRMLNSAYENFVKVVNNGRPNLTEEQVRSLANGDIYVASEALSNGLVDHIGYLEQAVNKAAQLAQVQGQPRVTQLRDPKGFRFSAYFGAQSPDTLLTATPERLRSLATEMMQSQVMYLSPVR